MKVWSGLAVVVVVGCGDDGPRGIGQDTSAPDTLADTADAADSAGETGADAVEAARRAILRIVEFIGPNLHSPIFQFFERRATSLLCQHARTPAVGDDHPRGSLLQHRNLLSFATSRHGDRSVEDLGDFARVA